MGLMQKQFADLVTFTRAGTAGYWNWQGAYTIAAANEQRIDHDPATLSLSTSSVTLGTGQHTFATTRLYTVGDVLRASADANNWMIGRVIAATEASVTIEVLGVVSGSGTYSSWTLIVRLGIFVEGQSTRLNTASTGASLLTPTRATYVEDGTLFIDGTTPFRKLVESTDTGSHFGVPLNALLAANTAYTAQYVVKAAGRTKFSLDATSAAYWSQSGPRVAYDLQAMTAVGKAGATGTILAIGAGIFLVTWTAVVGGAAVNSAIYPFLQDAAGATSYTGDGTSGIYISGYQIEAGTLATSLIAGEGSQVTRAADLPAVNVLSPWFNQEQGTYHFIGRSYATKGYPTLFHINPDFFGFINPTLATKRVYLNGRGSTGFLASDSSKPVMSETSYAVGFDSSGAAASVDGSTASAVVRAKTAGAATALHIGKLINNTSHWNGHIRVIRYYPRRLSNAELQALTT